jgi:hypothetical protein
MLLTVLEESEREPDIGNAIFLFVSIENTAGFNTAKHVM